MTYRLKASNSNINNNTIATDSPLNNAIMLLFKNDNADDNDNDNDEKHSTDFPPLSLSNLEPHHKYYNSDKEKYRRGFEDKFMILTDGCLTEDDISEQQRQQHTIIIKYQQENRITPLDIPISSASLSPLSSFHNHVTHSQQTKEPMPSVTCPVSSNKSAEETSSSIEQRDKEFMVGSMPEQESPIPWPLQFVSKRIINPDNVMEQQHLSGYILSPVPVIGMADDDLPFLFYMDD